MSILATLIKEKKAALEISEREISRRAGVSATTIGRVLKGETIDVDTLNKICDWLGVSPSSVLDAYAPTEAGLGQKITAMLGVNPALAAVFEEVVGKIERGEVSAATLRDIIAYINYRINLEASDGSGNAQAPAGGGTRS